MFYSVPPCVMMAERTGGWEIQPSNCLFDVVLSHVLLIRDLQVTIQSLLLYYR
jgi:hypothetical protein